MGRQLDCFKRPRVLSEFIRCLKDGPRSSLAMENISNKCFQIKFKKNLYITQKGRSYTYTPNTDLIKSDYQ